MAATRLVLLSDTHGLHDRVAVPDGDVLVHAGDFTRRGRPEEVEGFARFLARLPHTHKVVVAGNHDFLFQREPERARELLGDVTYLEDSGAEVAGLAFWGSPWQPWFHDWAFNLRRGPELAAVWARIPAGTDVLVTHGPPRGTLDRVARGGERVGCAELAAALRRVRPRLHVFGHIHEAYGHAREGDTLLVNACTCDLGYAPVQPAVVVDWDATEGPRIAASAGRGAR
jgi:Icc-related predicted phosphoesterase